VQGHGDLLVLALYDKGLLLLNVGAEAQLYSGRQGHAKVMARWGPPARLCPTRRSTGGPEGHSFGTTLGLEGLLLEPWEALLLSTRL
jgi:hypothetical protein